MNEDKYPVKSTLVLDIMSAALSIEESFGEFLVPPKVGAYLPGQIDPILKEGVDYYLYETTNMAEWNIQYGLYRPRYRSSVENRPVGHMRPDLQREGRFKVTDLKTLEKVDYRQAVETKRSVIDENGKVIVTPTQAHRLTLAPTLPVTALELVQNLVEDYVRQFRKWEKHNTNNENAIIALHLNRDVVWVGDLESGDNMYQAWRAHRGGIAFDKGEVMEGILSQMRTLRAEIAQFIGDDEWRVHFLRYHGPRAVALIKSEDYRIIVYNEKTGSGEW